MGHNSRKLSQKNTRKTTAGVINASRKMPLDHRGRRGVLQSLDELTAASRTKARPRPTFRFTGGGEAYWMADGALYAEKNDTIKIMEWHRPKEEKRTSEHALDFPVAPDAL